METALAVATAHTGAASLSEATAIVGVGHSAIGKLPGRSAWSLQVEAVRRALDDAGLTKDDVDGLFTEAQLSEPLLMHCTMLGRHLGLRPRVAMSQSQGGATAISLIQTAAMAVQAGMCSVAVCVLGDNAKTGMPNIYGLAMMGRGTDFPAFGHLGGPGLEALACRRHMHTYGTTHEQLGHIPVTFRAHAQKTPHAQMREPMTLDDYMGARWVVEPFRLFDCCVMSDFGAAVVVTSAERARDLAQAPVLIRGMGQAHNLASLGPLDPDHYTTYAGARSSIEAYRMAGIGPADVDVAEIYDGFSYVALVTLEDYGFCAKGEGGPFCADGNIALGGTIPTNTSGGLLSEGYLLGMGHVIEATRQLRGECGERQVDGAEIAAVSGHGGFQATHATLILRGGQ